MGASVVLLARRPSELDRVAAEMRSSTGNDDVTVLPADLASLASVRQAADRFLACHDRLDVLINNAGVSLNHRSVTVDGFETTFAVNHLGPVPAHQPAAGTAQAQRAQPGRQRHLDGVSARPDQLR
jgi:NAD(P)-dependent dehydrogenase (short-subunit alcohol dehydrogenase family)